MFCPIASMEHVRYHTGVYANFLRRRIPAVTGQRKENRRSGERVVPSMDRGSSRVSRAAGSVGSQTAPSTRVEQRSNVPPSRQSMRTQPPTRSPKRTKTGQSSQSGQGSRRSSQPSRAGRSTSVAAPPADPKDTQFIKWAREKWNSLEAHHQQRVLGAILLSLTLL